MARPFKPVALHRLEGTYQPVRHAHREHEPHAPGQLADVEPPDFLTPSQKRLWNTLIHQAPQRVLRAGDWALFTAFVVQVDVLAEATEARAGAPLVDGDGKPAALLRLSRQTTEMIRLLAGELGYSPAARARLGSPQAFPEPEEVPRFQKFNMLLPSGKVVRYRPPNGSRKTRVIS